jgi:hypothetical protein
MGARRRREAGDVGAQVAGGARRDREVRLRRADRLRYLIEVAADRLWPLMHGSAMTHVTRDMLRSVQVAVPSGKAQREIADFLDPETARIDALIEKKRRMIGLLAERRSTLTVDAVESGGWPRVKLTLVARLGSGHTPSRERPDWWRARRSRGSRPATSRRCAATGSSSSSRRRSSPSASSGSPTQALITAAVTGEHVARGDPAHVAGKMGLPSSMLTRVRFMGIPLSRPTGL